MWANALYKKKWGAAMLSSLFAILLGLAIGGTTPFEILELRITDRLFEWRGPLDLSDSPVVLVAISDQADLEIPEPWPWPRSYHARLVDNLNAAGARVIGFDVTFPQPDEHHPHNDSLFAQAIRRHGNVILAGDIRSERRGGASELVQYLPPFRELHRNNPNAWGYVSNHVDDDASIRRYLPVREHLNTRYHPLGLELIRYYKNLDTLVVRDTGSHFDLGFVRIPKDDRNSMLINYHGGPGSFPEFSYDQIIDDGNTILTSDRDFFGLHHPDEKDFGDFDDPDYGLLHTGDLKDKIVIVGATLPELQDFHPTPFSPHFPGYEIHANAVQTILNENFLQNANPWILLSVILLPVILICFFTIYKGAVGGFFLMIALAAVIIAGVYLLFIHFATRLDLIIPMMSILLGYMSSTSYSFFVEQMEKRRIRNIFGSYVSPELVNTMIESGEEPQLGGNEVYITAFFSDIQSFSAFSEKLPPAQLVDLINEYLSGMTDILTGEQGTLDKYIGDAIVAFFGAPIPIEDHALRACITSQRMILKQRELCEKWKKERNRWPDIVPQMQTRIGINTGWMVTGNMGSSTRFNYTMMGDNVNLAARCESGAKSYGVYTMVTEDTKREAQASGDDCIFRYLDKTVVVGRTQPVNLYEIVGLRSVLGRDALECVEIFEAASTRYLNQEWNQAIKGFRESSKLEPYQPRTPGIKTNPSLLMIDRCQAMATDPPGNDWDGVFVMKSK